ncbi:MAG: exo-alpha-sialidase [Deltaproteobacteria bacterium]|nr:exo-alpha-sialidase [Deltaproteobacteria bacterium]
MFIQSRSRVPLTAILLAITLGACQRRDVVNLGPVEHLNAGPAAVVATIQSPSVSLYGSHDGVLVAWLQEDGDGRSVVVRHISETLAMSAAGTPLIPSHLGDRPVSRPTIVGGVNPEEVSLIWQTTRPPQEEAFVVSRTSEDNGRSWSTGIERSLGLTAPTSLVVADVSGTPFVTWLDQRVQRHRILFARLIEGSQQWLPSESRFIHDPGDDSYTLKLSVASDGADRIAVVWQEDATCAINAIFSRDGGLKWSDPVRLDDRGELGVPAIARVAFAGKRAVAVWSGGGQLWADSSADGGDTWGVDTLLEDNDLDDMPNFDLLGSRDVAHIAFDAEPGGRLPGIYHVALNQDGVWSAEHEGMRAVGTRGGKPAHPRLAREQDGTVYVTYEQDGRVVLLARSTDEGATFERPITIYDQPIEDGTVRHLQVAASGGVAYVVWETLKGAERAGESRDAPTEVDLFLRRVSPPR